MEKRKKVLRISLIIVLDILLIGICGFLALLTRFEFSFGNGFEQYAKQLAVFIAIQSVITVGVFFLRKMYHYVWRMVSVFDVAGMILSALVAFALSFLVSAFAGVGLPKSVVFIDLICVLAALVGMRCFLRFYDMAAQILYHSRGNEERILLIGAGEAGRILLQELRSQHASAGKVYGMIDDNPGKWGKMMNGTPILGGREKIPELVKKKKITQIIFAIPSAKAADRLAILQLCQSTGCRKIRTLPSIYQLVSGQVRLNDVKAVQVEDLLGRDPVELNQSKLDDFMRDRVVLVTGGGGSIGSELCRQIAEREPRKLIVVDIYENNAYDIQQELRSKYPDLDLNIEIASIRDKEKIQALFQHYRPELVFHAAAHKHVPLMEANPEEAIKNNIFGTYHVVRAAEKSGVKRFVMISTDKAVNPTNIMGATKRFCEMILQSRKESATEFCAVRFGNVLGSNGSVVPLFKRQIEEGGPITITDKRIIRYFMTIPEAAQLVLEAGAMASPGQIFVLDMGEPVKIVSLAENLIRLSGLEPYKDIKIQEIGLRPGEKLYEELLTGGENLSKTANEKIFIEQNQEISKEHILSCLEQLDVAVTSNSSNEELVALMMDLVPTYVEPDRINNEVKA